MEILFRDQLILIDECVLRLPLIPCRVRVGREMEVFFERPLHSISGIVKNWDYDEIASRGELDVGGQYHLNQNARLSVRQLEGQLFQITHLEMFSQMLGWWCLIRDGEYS